MNGFDNLMSDIEQWRAAYEREQAHLHNRALELPTSAVARSMPGRRMVKSLPVEDIDAVALHRRIIEGGRKFQQQITKSLGQFDEMTKSLASRPGVTVTRSDDREAKAAWLNRKLAELDRCIAAKTITAEQASIVENRIHHTARRLGLV